MRKKNFPRGIRSAGGQTTLQSFLFKPSVVAPPPPEEAPTSPPEPRKREIIRVTKATIKEKARAFSSVGKSGDDDGDASGAGALAAAVFRRFNRPAPASRAEPSSVAAAAAADADDDGGGVRLEVKEIAGAAGGRQERAKRKSSLGDGERHGGEAKRVLVLGDDPKPRPATRAMTRPGSRGEGAGNQALYNHYASGGGWWEGEKEGVDGEEVGWTDDMWEGMGSISLGGMEWH